MNEQLVLDDMPAIAPLADYLERIVRTHPRWAGEVMSDGLATACEVGFEIDAVQMPVAAQRLFAQGWLS